MHSRTKILNVNEASRLPRQVLSKLVIESWLSIVCRSQLVVGAG
jgi:hypothetical protein